MWLWHTNGSPNLGQKTRPYSNQQKKKRTCKIVDFAVPADHKIKLKESEKKDKYLNFAREYKKTMEHERDDYTNCESLSANAEVKNSKGMIIIVTKTRSLTRILKENWNQLDYRINLFWILWGIQEIWEDFLSFTLVTRGSQIQQVGKIIG